MPTFTIKNPLIAGFTAAAKAPGEKEVEVIVKGSLTSDDPNFHFYMEQLSNMFFDPINVPRSTVVKALILIHEKGTATIFLNDFSEIANIIVARSVKQGEPVFKTDISQMVTLTFPEIQIQPKDQLIFIFREDWRFGLYFDFTQNLDLEVTSRGLADLKYKLLFQLSQSAIELADRDRKTLIFTEGKTDSKHLSKALGKLNIDLPIQFSMSEKHGSGWLMRICESLSLVSNYNKRVFVFDRDEPEIIRCLQEKTANGKTYQNWGNNVFSFMVPVPSHRQEADAICIELCYQDDEITRSDSNGRRLFLSTEFDPQSRKLLSNPEIHSTRVGPGRNDRIRIIDADVFYNGQNCALPKSDFADYVSSDADNFNDFNFSEFSKVFDTIKEILNQ